MIFSESFDCERYFLIKISFLITIHKISTQVSQEIIGYPQLGCTFYIQLTKDKENKNYYKYPEI